MKNLKGLLNKTAAFLMMFVFVSLIPIEESSGWDKEKRVALRFNKSGNFKIVQFADIQDGPNTDPRTIRLMNNVLESEKPDLVILSGDNTDKRCKTKAGFLTAVKNLSAPMEKRHIPWAVVFGNHDEENGILSKEEMMKVYMSFPYNISQPGPADVDGVGNYNLLVKGSASDKPVFNIYLLDSGSYAPVNIGGYDWIKPSQLQWYKDTSAGLKEKYSEVIPSLMFFHIPLPEFKELWKSGKAIGERNESEHCSKINSGLFSCLLEMGDVKGVFVGHDHTNDYFGDFLGIKLGYSRNVGFGTYGKKGLYRGARVFQINENELQNIQTWMREASEF